MNSIKFSTDQGRSIAYPQPRMPSIHSKLQIGVKLTGNAAAVMLNTANDALPTCRGISPCRGPICRRGRLSRTGGKRLRDSRFQVHEWRNAAGFGIPYCNPGAAGKDSEGKTANGGAEQQ